MGLFDTVYVSGDVLSAWPFHCRACGPALPAGSEWQTKSLQSCMDCYYVRHDDSGAIRLYLLDRPSDRRFWRPWTEQEIAESERMAERNGIRELSRKKAGEGCFLPEAYLPEHRRQRFMGELPHQWVEIHSRCVCGASVQHWIKFCDGIATEIRSEGPGSSGDSLDNTGGLDQP